MRSARCLPLLFAVLAPRATAAPIPDGAFVRAEGGRFLVQGRPQAFYGANFDVMHGDRRRGYREILRALAADGFTLGRQWVVGEGPGSPSEWSRRHELVRAGPDSFIDRAYAQLDRVLTEARALGLRIILTLSNHWPDHGGVPAYLRWAGLPSEGYQQEAFYSDERTRAAYRAGLDRLLLRTNTVTGIRYRDDPTIFAWELMNESVVLTEAGHRARLKWIAEMAGYIKARDPNHMVSPGLLGYASRRERRWWIESHQIRDVDYCDSHLYPEAQDAARLRRLIDDALADRAQLAHHIIRKPLLIGEFGFLTDQGPRILGQPRASWFRRFLGETLRNGGGGALVWIYEAYEGKPRNYGIYTDRPDTDDVRALLRGMSPAFRAAPVVRNLRISVAAGDRLLYDPLMRLHGSAAPHRDWRPEGDALTLAIAPERFSRGEFERAGVWDRGALVHAYGADAGFFEYRFAAPPSGCAGLRLRARLSSEWPGRSAPPDGGSTVRVLVDGVEFGRLPAVPDDGIGRLEELAATSTLRPGVHTLRLQVDEGGNGVTIYGEATGKEPVPQGRYGPMELRCLPPR